MRKTNHILHGALTLLTVGFWGIGWGMIALRNWAYNESHGFNDPQRSGQSALGDAESNIRYSSHGSFVLASITPVDGSALLSARPVKRPVSVLGSTFLPKVPTKKRPIFGDEIKREFVLDQELTEMFEEIGVRDPADMQKIIDLALADTATALPRNRLLLSFGNYARSLIKDNDLQIS